MRRHNKIIVRALSDLISISMHHALLAEIVEKHSVTILGMIGAGKSHAAKTLHFPNVRAGRQVVAIDPQGAWRGFPFAMNGSDRIRILPMVVFGDKTKGADIQIVWQMGETVARVIAGAKISAVIDLSHLRSQQADWFCILFLEELRDLWRRDPSARWLVLDEAHRLAPQVPRGVGKKRLLNIVEDFALTERSTGVRVMALTQRLAKISKDVISEVGGVITLRLVSKHDQRAANDLMSGIGDATAIGKTLGQLQLGESWCATLNSKKAFRLRFPALDTLDTSATPDAPAVEEQKGFTPERLAEILRLFNEQAECDGVLEPAENGPGDQCAAKALEQLRINLNLSAAEFAERLGRTAGNVGRYVNGTVAPTTRLLELIAANFGAQLRIDFLLPPDEGGIVVPFRRTKKDDPNDS